MAYNFTADNLTEFFAAMDKVPQDSKIPATFLSDIFGLAGSDAAEVMDAYHMRNAGRDHRNRLASERRQMNAARTA